MASLPRTAARRCAYVPPRRSHPIRGNLQTPPPSYKGGNSKGQGRHPRSRAERYVGELIVLMGFECFYEDRLLETGLSGRRKGGLVPDWSIPALGVCLEVCEGKPVHLQQFKLPKIRAAARRNDVKVILIGRRELDELYLRDESAMRDILLNAGVSPELLFGAELPIPSE